MAFKDRRVASKLQAELSRLAVKYDEALADLRKNVRSHLRTDEQRQWFDLQVGSEHSAEAAQTWAQQKMDRLHSLLWEVVPQDLQGTYKPGQLSVVFSRTVHGFNACARWKGSPLVEIHRGILADLAMLDPMLMRCFEPCDEVSQRCDQFCSFTCQYFAKKVLTQAGSNNERIEANDVPVLSKALELSVACVKEPWACLYGSILLSWQLYFVLCHEVAHHVMGHLARCSWRNRRLGGTRLTYEIATLEQQQELDADSRAMDWCLRTIRMLRPLEGDTKELIYTHWATAAPDLFFQASQYLQARARMKRSTTHPLAIVRRKAILANRWTEITAHRDALDLARLGERLFAEAARRDATHFTRLLSD